MSTIKVDGIRSNSASSDAITLADNGTCTANITNNLSNRNLIINGAMQVAQRGTSFTANGNYTLDRWRVDEAMSAGAATITQSTTSPDGFSNSLKVDITSADTSVAAGEYSQVYQYIEAQNLQQLAYGTSAAKTVTLSFYVRSNKTGNYNVGILQPDISSRLVSLQYTINSADTWERKSFTISGDASGQINNDNGTGYSIFWGLAYGTNYTSGSLQSSFTGYSSANFAAGQSVNLFDSTSNEWYITGVQLEVGSVATDFEHRYYAQELALCQRYYYQIGSTNIGSGDYAILLGYTFNNGTRIAAGFIAPQAMRATPSISEIGNGISGYGQGVNEAIASIFGIVGATDTNWIGFIADGTSSFDWGNDKFPIALTNTGGGGIAFNAEL